MLQEGKNKGVFSIVSKAVENDGGSRPLIVRCIIHQQSFCTECLDMSEVLKPVVSSVNYIIYAQSLSIPRVYRRDWRKRLPILNTIHKYIKSTSKINMKYIPLVPTQVIKALVL